MEEVRAFLFDFDGVVADTLPDIASAVNAALAHFSCKALPQETVAAFVGNGARSLLERSFGAACSESAAASPWERDSGGVFAWYRDYYRAHCMERTRLYPGFRGLLELLELRGIPAAVVTNKPQPVTDALLEKLGIRRFFAAAICPEQVRSMKPHPEGLLLALDRINGSLAASGKESVPASSAMMVGDSATDIQAGKAAGMRTCAVTGGYGDTGLLRAQSADVELVLASELLCRILRD